MSLQGMGDYDRDNGYTQGSVTLGYQTKTMTQDRGRLFNLDPMDINEANFIPTASAVMGEFQRMHVVPEIDAYRISKVATEAITAEKAGMVDYGYTPGATGTSALRAFKEGIKAVQDNYTGPLVCQATTDFIMELELELAGKITATTFSKGGIDTQVPSVDRVPIIPTSSNRMYMEEYFSQSLEVELLLRLCPDDEDTIYQIMDLLVDTCATKRKTLRIAGDDKPAEVVCSRFMKLNADHIRFVLKCFAENSSPIRNMKQYLLASLYNAPTTMQLSYQNQTNHDLANRR